MLIKCSFSCLEASFHYDLNPFPVKDNLPDSRTARYMWTPSKVMHVSRQLFTQSQSCDPVFWQRVEEEQRIPCLWFWCSPSPRQLANDRDNGEVEKHPCIVRQYVLVCRLEATRLRNVQARSKRRHAWANWLLKGSWAWCGTRTWANRYLRYRISTNTVDLAVIWEEIKFIYYRLSSRPGQWR